VIHALHVRQLDRYFAGTLRPAAATEILGRLWRCAACRVRYERHLLHERALPDGEARQQERLWQAIVASARTETSLGAASRISADIRPRPFRPFRPSVVVGAAALAGVLFWVAVGPGSPPGPARGGWMANVKTASEPVARGITAERAEAPAVHLYRAVGDHQTEPVTRTIHAQDGLLIAYSNPGAELSYLMLFAVDVQGGVHWYYPSYEQPGENPGAPAIQTRALGVELGEEIHHALPVGPLRMISLFLRRPLRVKEVEEMVSEAWRSRGGSVTALETLPLPMDDGEQLSTLLEVSP
jgi:hypothetical protein